MTPGSLALARIAEGGALHDLLVACEERGKVTLTVSPCAVKLAREALVRTGHPRFSSPDFLEAFGKVLVGLADPTDDQLSDGLCDENWPTAHWLDVARRAGVDNLVILESAEGLDLDPMVVTAPELCRTLGIWPT